MINITEAEFKIMEIIWDEEQVSIPEIISKCNNTKWSQNTIRTLIRRLRDKGVIQDNIVDGKVKYKSLIDKNEYLIEVSHQFLDKFYNGSIPDFVVECVKQKFIKPQKVREILLK